MKLQVEPFDNLLEKIPFTSTELQEQIRIFPLEFDRFKHQEVEWGMRLPMFVDGFYPLVLSNKKVPTQRHFWEAYRDGLPREMTAQKTLMRGVRARLLRTYPSLVRDLHFALFLWEHARNARVIYNRDLDVEHGIDVLVVYQEEFFAINLFTHTRRAFQGRVKKGGRHEAHENVQVIELPVMFTKQHRCGKFYLYGKQELECLRHKFQFREFA